MKVTIHKLFKNGCILNRKKFYNLIGLVINILLTLASRGARGRALILWRLGKEKFLLTGCSILIIMRERKFVMCQLITIYSSFFLNLSC